jgi:hypothetical protein
MQFTGRLLGNGIIDNLENLLRGIWRYVLIIILLNLIVSHLNLPFILLAISVCIEIITSISVRAGRSTPWR